MRYRTESRLISDGRRQPAVSRRLLAAGYFPAKRPATALAGGRRPAFTLLEVILALALTTVVLGLVGMAIHVNFNVADKSRRRVEEAQLARALLQRIADDLRNAVPYSPASPGTSGSSTSSGSSSSTGSTGSSGSSTSSGSSGASTSSDSTSDSLCGGLYGSLNCVQVDTSHRPRPAQLASATATWDQLQPTSMSEVTTVTYSLGDPGMGSPTGQSSAPSASQSGLYRRALDRTAFLFAMQQGQSSVLTQATDVLASEVINLEFTYYTGTTTSDTWDSSQQGTLPSAVKVTVSFRRTTAGAAASTSASSPVVYDMLVDLPNSQVASAGQGSSSSGSSTSPTNTSLSQSKTTTGKGTNTQSGSTPKSPTKSGSSTPKSPTKSPTSPTSPTKPVSTPKSPTNPVSTPTSPTKGKT